MARGRIATAFEAWQLDRKASIARRAEDLALREVGRAVFDGGAPIEAGAEGAFERIARSRQREAVLVAALNHSLDVDRDDYRDASAWLRPIVVLRGVCSRAILRDRVRRFARERQPAYRSLAEIALDGAHPSLAMRAPAGAPERVARERGLAEGFERERVALLTRYGGSALPGWAEETLHETPQIGRLLVKEARGKLLPRAPALAGLAAGWWVTHTFATASWRTWVHEQGASLGISVFEEKRRIVSEETASSLAFWAPIVAAALCAWLCNYLAGRIRRRYMPDSASASPGASGGAELAISQRRA